jgi:Fe-S-cluster containining protein
MALQVLPQLMRMRGSDDAPPRCCALEGTVGVAVRCAIYAQRPSPCRDFAPYASLGIGDEACARARRRYALPAL